MRMGWDPACPIIRQGSPWHQTVSVAMGSEGLLPRMQDLDATELAAQILAAALEQCLAGSPQEPCEEGAFVDQDECIELSSCGSVKTPWKYGTGRRSAWRSATPCALVRVCHLGPWRLRHELEA
jgi:hypothetical protein